jgi:hypothetical protein
LLAAAQTAVPSQAIAIAAVGAAAAIFSAVVSALVLQTDPGNRGFAAALYGIASSGSAAIGGLLDGLLTEIWSVRVALAFGGAAGFGVAAAVALVHTRQSPLERTGAAPADVVRAYRDLVAKVDRIQGVVLHVGVRHGPILLAIAAQEKLVDGDKPLGPDIGRIGVVALYAPAEAAAGTTTRRNIAGGYRRWRAAARVARAVRLFNRRLRWRTRPFIELIPGDLSSTVPGFAARHVEERWPVKLLYVDCEDGFDPTWDVLVSLGPLLAPGGIVVVGERSRESKQAGAQRIALRQYLEPAGEDGPGLERVMSDLPDEWFVVSEKLRDDMVKRRASLLAESRRQALQRVVRAALLALEQSGRAPSTIDAVDRQLGAREHHLRRDELLEILARLRTQRHCSEEEGQFALTGTGRFIATSEASLSRQATKPQPRRRGTARRHTKRGRG